MSTDNHTVPVAAERTTTPSTTRKTSLYRLRAAGAIAHTSLRSFVLPRYLDREGFKTRKVNHPPPTGVTRSAL
ncbi:hypothetical protein ACWEJ6_43230 [Nonomuraea sp. NPDC004702]